MAEFKSLLRLRDKIRQRCAEPLFMDLAQFAIALRLLDKFVDEIEHFSGSLANSDALYLLAELDFLIIAARGCLFDLGSDHIGKADQFNLSRKQRLHRARIVIETTNISILWGYLGHGSVLSRGASDT